MAKGVYNEVVRSQHSKSVARMKWLNWDCYRLGWLIEYIRTVVCASGDYLCQIISSHNSSIQRWIGLSTGPFICGMMYIRVSHLQFFWILMLFQAGTSACHTQEQKKYRCSMFYVGIFQLFWTFVSYNYNLIAKVDIFSRNYHKWFQIA